MTGVALASPTEQEWATVCELVRAAGEVYLVCHINPDGDALGSALAVAMGLREKGKRAFVSFGDDPLVVPGSLSFLPGLDLLVPPAEVPETPELMMVFDAASLDRLGLLVPAAKRAAALVVVDHHVSNTRFGTHHLIDVTAPATAVVVDGLLDRLGVKLTADIAAALYAGLASDTGSFKYVGTTPATHEFAARLLRTGIRHDLISREIWDTAEFGYLKVLARALERATLAPDEAGGAGLVWTVVPRADRAEFGVAMDQIEGIIDVVRKTVEAEVAVVFKEDGDGTFRVSTRSKGRIDVGTLCTALGGGGHRLAAGFTSPDVDVTLQRIRSALAAEVESAAGAEAGAAAGTDAV